LEKIKIVGIHGKAGSGKDFIADSIYSDYFRISFADHFKCDIVGKGIYTYDQVYITKEPEVRHGIQRIGTEEGRDVYGENVWIHCIEAWVRTFYEKNKITKFIMADVRFDNEAEWEGDGEMDRARCRQGGRSLFDSDG
jgi:ABC-type dipeptide/oligopeptide/nickel transport system ATPase component